MNKEKLLEEQINEQEILADKTDNKIKEIILSELPKLNIYTSIKELPFPIINESHCDYHQEKIYIGIPKSNNVNIINNNYIPMLDMNYIPEEIMNIYIFNILLNSLSDYLAKINPLEEAIVFQIESLEVWHPDWEELYYFLKNNNNLLEMEDYPDSEKFSGLFSGFSYYGACKEIEARNERCAERNQEKIIKYFNSYKNFFCSFKIYKRRHFGGEMITVIDENGQVIKKENIKW